jgi:ribose transport system ATP-binding protein
MDTLRSDLPRGTSSQQPHVMQSSFDDPSLAETGNGDSQAILSLKNITKRFPGAIALQAIDFTLRSGEVHVLFGENGAGKSTLTNIILGILKADEGQMQFAGQSVRLGDPHLMRNLGISAVFQEFSLVTEMAVEENLYLGRELRNGVFLDKVQMRKQTTSIMKRLGFDILPDARISSLSRAQQQMVEIAKALLLKPKVLILDEPTASLTEAESETLFGVIDDLRRTGVGIVYISHRMAEIRKLADRITVLRDGKLIGVVEASNTSNDELIEMMTGRVSGILYPDTAHHPGSKRLQVRNLTTRGGTVRNADIHVCAGEIVGIAGLVGCGKSELARAVFGLEQIAQGQVLVNGAEIPDPSPAALLKKGVCYFPSDRATEGLAMNRTVVENASLTALMTPKVSRFGVLQLKEEFSQMTKILDRLNLRPLNMHASAAAFSGGNKQKIVLARGFARNTEIFLFDEPTVGIDVGAKAEIYALISELALNGAAVLLVSSELPEVLGLSHRAYVMCNGDVVAELQGGQLAEENVLPHFFPGNHSRLTA